MNTKQLIQMAEDGIEQSNFTEGGFNFSITFRMIGKNYCFIGVTADGKSLNGGGVNYVLNDEAAYERLSDYINDIIDDFLDENEVGFTNEEASNLKTKLTAPTGGVKLTAREAKALADMYG